MDSGYYAAMTGLMARTQALDTAASNLANAQTPGYRAEREFFRSVLMGPDATNSQLGKTINNYGLLGGDVLNMAQGSIQATGNQFDLALEGPGFFQVMSANGVRYTRNGNFHRTPQGQLVDAENEPVLSINGQAISVPPGNISIGETGAISLDGGIVANLGIVKFPEGTRLKPEGTNHYVAPQGTTTTLATDTTVHQGALEASNQDVIQGTMDLIMMQRQAEMMQKALTIFHTEFNKIASEDIARV
jgi:flagellar basal-body rod protein FlgF/flagellar basal-body rod protein FlgG